MALTPALALAQFKHHQFFNHQFLLASGLNIAACDFSLTILGDSDEELLPHSVSAPSFATRPNTPLPAPLDLSIRRAQFFHRISDLVIIDWDSPLISDLWVQGIQVSQIQADIAILRTHSYSNIQIIALNPLIHLIWELEHLINRGCHAPLIIIRTT
jgi:hypothetical protein